MSPVRRRRVIVGLAVALVILIGGVLVFRACSPMTVASWGAKAALEAVVGDHGTVSAHAIDQSFSSPPRCDLRVSVDEGTGVDELTELLSGIAPEARYQPCTVTTVSLANHSLLLVFGLPDFTVGQWAAIAEQLHRGSQTISVGTEYSPANVSPFIGAEDMTGYLERFHALTAGARLEESIGPIHWSNSWTLAGAPYHSVDIETSGTPPAELGAFLEAMAPALASTDTSVDIRYRTPDTGPVTLVEVSTSNPALEAQITAAFDASGLPGTLTIAYGKAVGD